MNDKGRRRFFKQLGTLGGVLALSGDLLKTADAFQDKTLIHHPKKIGVETRESIDFRYEPGDWQSLYCFPDDAFKSVIRKDATLLYGITGTTGGAENSAKYRIEFGVAKADAGKFISQEFEAAGVPIVETKLQFGEAIFEITSFASDDKDEGRVDNHIIQISPQGGTGVDCSPAVSVLTAERLFHDNKDDGDVIRKQVGMVSVDGGGDAPLFVVDSPLEEDSIDGGKRYTMQSGTAQPDKPLVYVVRIPQEKQKLEGIKKGLTTWSALLEATRAFWKGWSPIDAKHAFAVHPDYEPFLSASVQEILQTGRNDKGKKTYVSGQSPDESIRITDAAAIMEALAYAGYDKEAQASLERVWDLQNSDGGFTGKGGELNFKETAAAIYAITRMGELTQDWSYYLELWPDIYKAAMYLSGRADSAYKNGTLNGEHGFLPRGVITDSSETPRAEITNSLWTAMALKKVTKICDHLGLLRRDEVKKFGLKILLDLQDVMKSEERKHPKGFSYIPMLLKDDPAWNKSDEHSQPMPQFAVEHLAEAYFPGMIFKSDNATAVALLSLLKDSVAEGTIFGTGKLGKNGLEPYVGPLVGSVFLWAGLPDLAISTFRGFLNHGSPLYGWAEEQTLHEARQQQLLGEMPSTRASAECIRFLRNTMILEDEDNLRLMDGIVEADLEPGKALSVSYTPTKWGRVSVSLEPVDQKSWKTIFVREDFNKITKEPLKWVTFPRKFSQHVQLLNIDGAKFVRNGMRVQVDPEATRWEATWWDPKKS